MYRTSNFLSILSLSLYSSRILTLHLAWCLVQPVGRTRDRRPLGRTCAEVNELISTVFDQFSTSDRTIPWISNIELHPKYRSFGRRFSRYTQKKNRNLVARFNYNVTGEEWRLFSRESLVYRRRNVISLDKHSARTAKHFHSHRDNVN